MREETEEIGVTEQLKQEKRTVSNIVNPSVTGNKIKK